MKRRLTICNVGINTQTEEEIIAWNLSLVRNPRIIHDRDFKRNGQWCRTVVIQHDGILKRRTPARRAA